jgi:hypothetical protein
MLTLTVSTFPLPSCTKLLMLTLPLLTANRVLVLSSNGCSRASDAQTQYLVPPSNRKLQQSQRWMDIIIVSLIYLNIVLMDRYSALIMVVIVVREVSCNHSPLLPIIPN